MRKKSAVCAVIFVIAILTGFLAFAEETDGSRITNVYAYTGKLYYCDDVTGNIVMKSVKPAFETPEANDIARMIEYTEIPAAWDALRFFDGAKAEYSWLNNYVDSEVWFTVAKTADGRIRVLYFQFK